MAHKLTAQQALTLFCTPQRRALPTDAERFLDTAGRITIMHGTRGLAGYVWGRENAPTVLLVHGWESHAGNMRGFVPLLLARGLRVVAMDAPAHGASPGSQTNLIDYGDALYNATRQLGPLHGIIAHSFGAPATVGMLERYPQVDVERLVLIGSPCVLRHVLTGFAANTGLDAATFNAMMRLLEKQVGYSVDWFSVDRMTVARQRQVLLVHDRQDEIVPFSEGQRIAHAWTDAHFLVTAGLGHRRLLRDAAVIGQIVAFMGMEERQAAGF